MIRDQIIDLKKGKIRVVESDGNSRAFLLFQLGKENYALDLSLLKRINMYWPDWYGVYEQNLEARRRFPYGLKIRRKDKPDSEITFSMGEYRQIKGFATG